MIFGRSITLLPLPTLLTFKGNGLFSSFDWRFPTQNVVQGVGWPSGSFFYPNPNMTVSFMQFASSYTFIHKHSGRC